MQMQLADQMVKMVKEDPKRLEAIRANPLPEIEKLKTDAEKVLPAYIYDELLYRIAVIVLGLLALIAAGSSVILVIRDKTTPEVLVALGSASVGALVGLFAPSPASK